MKPAAAYAARACLALAGLYCAFLCALYLGQGRMLFPASAWKNKTEIGRAIEARFPFSTPFKASLASGAALSCYRNFPQWPAPERFVLVLHGNADHAAAALAAFASDAPGLPAVSCSYPGFGDSPGNAGIETAFLAMAEFSDLFKPASFYGRSMGAGVGAALAARSGKRAVLASAWDSWAAVALDHLSPWVPGAVLKALLLENLEPAAYAAHAKPGFRAAYAYFSDDAVVAPGRTLALAHANPSASILEPPLSGGHNAPFPLHAALIRMLDPGNGQQAQR